MDNKLSLSPPADLRVENPIGEVFRHTPHSVIATWVTEDIPIRRSAEASPSSSQPGSPSHRTAAMQSYKPLEGVTVVINWANQPGPGCGEVMTRDRSTAPSAYTTGPPRSWQVEKWTEKITQDLENSIASINAQIREMARERGLGYSGQVVMMSATCDTEQTQTIVGTHESVGLRNPPSA